jgi:sporulation protein YlmC with PRC-barrel domain
MKKFNITMSLLLVAGLLAAAPVLAAENDHSKSSMSTPRGSDSSNSAFNVNDLIGKSVKNSRGDELGKVEDVIIGSDGRAQFVVLSRGGTLGVGAKYVPVPFNTLMSNSTNIARIKTDNDLIANLDKAKLDSAPSFSDKRFDLSSRDSQNKICSYYGAGACPFM